jgi:thioredoxin-dependent peroxiredoxin
MGLSIGAKAPDFELASTNGGKQRLSRDFMGKSVVLFFYPKDFSAVCTAEVCAFREGFAQYGELGVPVVGVSRDSMASHLKFKAAERLPFELLSDTTGTVCRAYDALLPLVGIPKRITYLLAPAPGGGHTVAAAYSNLLGSDVHVRQMLIQIQRLQAGVR